jgi:hypothetical protein
MAPMKVEVFHNTHDAHAGHIPFLTAACAGCFFELAYTYVTEGEGLDEIFTENQAIEGTDSELPVRYRTRSLSVGDMVRINDVTVWVIEAVGWSEATWEPRARAPAV